MPPDSIEQVPFRSVNFGEPSVEISRRPNGEIIIKSREPLNGGAIPKQMGVFLQDKAREIPDRIFMAERDTAGKWRNLSYGQALEQVNSVSQALLDHGHGPERPIAALSENSLNLAVLILAAMQLGVPIIPLSPAYALMSKDYAKLKYLMSLANPSLIYVPKLKPFEPALKVLDLNGIEILANDVASKMNGANAFDAYLNTTPGPGLEEAFARVNGDNVAKILFTSGSTGMPKGVMTTHWMLLSNGMAIDQKWKFLRDHPPVLVEWLPWHHTFGSNSGFNMTLRHGGTMYIDSGKPVPDKFQESLKNLREIQPTIHFNVPAAYDILVPALENDDDFARHFFGKMDILFFAGAALPQNLWDRLMALSIKATGKRTPILSGLGCTESSPVCIVTYWGGDRVDSLGLPVPSVEVKLIPKNDKLEFHARGPNITPGYYKQPEITERAFDEEGFFNFGDAVKFVDPDRPELGLAFNGRTAENFKLMTGTWVNVGKLRPEIISAGTPIIQDAVVTGHDREDIGLLVFPNIEGCKSVCSEDAADDSIESLIRRPEVIKYLKTCMEVYNKENPGSSKRISRVLLMSEPPSMDENESTEKGYINQRGVLDRRAKLVQRLYSDEPAADIIPL